jgi:hypothetical protein
MPRARKLAKSVRRLIVGCVLVIVLLAVAVTVFDGRLARMSLERIGRRSFGTAVTIDNTSVSALRGALHLDGMTIENPPGYRGKTFLALKQGDMRVKTTDLLGKELTIRDLAFDGLNVILEPSGAGSNLQDIIELLRRGPSLGRRLYVDHLTITNITVTVALVPSAGQVASVPVRLAPIEMSNLGHDEELTASKLAYKILAAVAVNLTKPNGVSVPSQTGNGVLDAVLGLGKALLGGKDANNAADGR